MRLQIIQLKPRMQTDKIISFDKKCFGISVEADYIYVSFHNATGDGEIRAMNRDGIVNKTIGNRLSLEGPSYICASPFSGNLCVSDFKKSTLLCLTPEGSTVYQYKSSNLHGVRGVYMDEKGTVIACGRDINNILIVSPTGTSHKTLLSACKSIQNPRCVTCRYDGGASGDKKITLIVGCNRNNNLFVLTLA